MSANKPSAQSGAKRSAMPALSAAGIAALDAFASALRTTIDVSPITIRNYLSDLRQFIAWAEAEWAAAEPAHSFAPTAISTPFVVRYRAYLQHTQRLAPASINRALISLKRYSAWLCAENQISRDPVAPVKLIPITHTPPRQLTSNEEEALMAAVQTHGTTRDYTLITLMLHTGLRAIEICSLRLRDIVLRKRSGIVRVYGKRNKYREVPLNTTARAVLAPYLATLSDPDAPLFPSARTGAPLTTRGLGYMITKYADLARVPDLSPHDLRHRFGYRMAAGAPLHRLAQIMGHDSLDTTLLYTQGTAEDLQHDIETIAWT